MYVIIVQYVQYVQYCINAWIQWKGLRDMQQIHNNGYPVGVRVYIQLYI